MPTRPLPLARKVHATAFRGFVTQLKVDPTLKRVVNLWRSWEGTDDDAAPLGSDSSVAIRLTPDSSEWSRTTITGSRDVSLTIAIEIFVPEGSAEESANLWDTIESLIASETFLTSMQAYGVWDVEVSSSVSQSADTSGSLTITTAKGRLLIST